MTPARILIAEDSPELGTVLKQVLTKVGHEVELVYGGDAAIARLEEKQFDVVVTDIVMDHVNGIEVVLFAKANCPNTQIVVMSVRERHLYLDSALGLGAKRALIKPFDNESLLQTVDELLEARMNP